MQGPVQDRTGAMIVATTGAPEDARVAGAGQVVGDKTGMGRIQYQFQICVGIEVGQGGRRQGAVPVGAAASRGEIELCQRIPQIVEDV